MSHAIYINDTWYWVATLNRIDKMIGLFCKRALYKRQYSAKETCHLIDPTYRSHPIHTWMSHAIYINDTWYSHEWVMSHTWMSHVTHVDESCRTCGWVMSHKWVSRVMQYESCHTHGWFMLHTWMSHVTHVDESCRTCGWVMLHIWMSHVTHMDESCHT